MLRFVIPLVYFGYVAAATIYDFGGPPITPGYNPLQGSYPMNAAVEADASAEMTRGGGSWWFACFLSTSPTQQYVVTANAILESQTRVTFLDLKTLEWHQSAFYTPVFYVNPPGTPLHVEAPRFRLTSDAPDNFSSMKLLASVAPENPLFPTVAAVNLTLTPQRPILYNMGTGKFPLQVMNGENIQLSVPGITVTGRITLPDGQTVDVLPDKSNVWFDRQYWLGPPNPNYPSHFTWHGINLDSGDRISYWSPDMNEKQPSWVTVLRPDGTHTIAVSSPASANRSGEYVSPHTGLTYWTSWTIEIPGVNAVLTLQAVTQDQETLAPLSISSPFSVVTGTFMGSRVKGYAVSDVIVG